ncbi:MAG: hypothetical protein KC461_15110, partial [Dehalococcoidia bacterium]|nr:hypothetical protein [Dehalococcoidia bacterium]
MAARPDSPTAFIDRHLLEGDPHRVLEGILVTCRATGATTAHVTLDGQPETARLAIEEAIAEARRHGILDGSALGGDPIAVEVDEGDATVVVVPEELVRAPEGAAPVVQVDLVLTQHGKHDVEVTITVHVAERHVLGLGDGDRVTGREGRSSVVEPGLDRLATRVARGDDVEVTVTVE